MDAVRQEDVKFRALLILAFLLLSVLAVAGEEPLETGLDPDWHLISDRNDIQVYMRHRDDSRLKTFRGVTRITLADENALAAVLNDYASYPRWLHFVDSASEFDRQGPLLRYLRFTTQLPWPLADREAVLQADVQQTLTKREESITIALNNKAGLLPPNPDYIRFPELQGIFKLRRIPDQENQVEITYQLVLDPGGYIPIWLVNILLRDAPYFTLERLRRIIVSPEYQGHFYDYLEVRGPGRPDTLAPARSYLYGFPPDQEYELIPPERVNELER